MSQKRKRQQWSPNQKLRLALESLQSENKTADICRREGLSPDPLYEWGTKPPGSAQAVYVRQNRGRFFAFRAGLDGRGAA